MAHVNDMDGNIVLANAFYAKRLDNTILKLLEVFPYTVNTLDRFGQYPLHVAISKGYSENVVLQILKKYPQAAGVCNNERAYPLHLACVNRQTDKVILSLFSKYPNAAAKKDIDGYYPLTCAVDSNCSENVVIQLLQAFPYAAADLDEEDVECPLHWACRNKYSPKVIFMFLDANLPVVKERLYGQTALDYYTSSEGDNGTQNVQSEKVIDVLKTLMKKSKYDLKNRIDIPHEINVYGLMNTRRYDTFHWLVKKQIKKTKKNAN
jgi:ankyrin repeat protein